MNLTFERIGVERRAKVDYWVERAVVDRQNAPAFFGAWKNAPDNIRSKLGMQRDASTGKVFVFRLMPKNSGLPQPKFPAPYILKSKKNLYPYQPRSVAHQCSVLMEHGASLDTSDTGLGKTYVSLSIAREMGLKPCIVCRRVGIAGWARACESLGLKPGFIANWELMRSGKNPAVDMYRKDFPDGSRELSYTWKLPKGSMLIWDEAHLANNRGTLQNALYESAIGIYPSLSLSATLADRLERMEPFVKTVRAMDSETFRKWAAMRQYVDQYERTQDISSTDDMKALNKLLFPAYGYRLSYTDPDVKKFFPDAIHNTEIIQIRKKDEQAQNELYEHIQRLAAGYQDMAHKAEKLTAILRYRQYSEAVKVPALVELTEMYVKENKSVAIFVNFRETLDILKKGWGSKASYIYGGQNDADRELNRKRFHDDKNRIIVCISDSGGQSIDLHDVRGVHQRVSLICPTYNPIILKQVLGRTRRAGARTIPIMKLLYAAGTIEESVASVVNNKIHTISALNDGELCEPDIFKLGVT